MPLYQILPQELPRVWEKAAPLLQKAIDLDPSMVTIEQVEFAVRTGSLCLLVWELSEGDITGAATVRFIDYPRERVGHIDLLGGSEIVKAEVFDKLKQWMRMNGATKAQCWAQGTHVHLYKSVGMQNTHQVMRIDLKEK